jgi:endonuclease/exonuclease/phosphatase family metal-dependent hydrolase
MTPAAPRARTRLGLGLLVVVLTALLTPGPATAGVPDRPLRVLTYNIHHGVGDDGVLDLERIARVVEDSGADVVGLQEVDRHWSARSAWVDQPAWLAERLDLHVAYAANLDLDPVNPGEPRRQFGTAILSRFPIKDSVNTLLPKFPGQEQRGLLEAELKVRAVPVVVAVTHLTSNNKPERQQQAERIIELLGGREVPVVLTGDLNAVPSASEISTLTRVFADVWTEAGSGPGYTYDTANPTKRIDYVLHSAGVTARAATVLTTNASDHLPLLADLTVRRY